MIVKMLALARDKFYWGAKNSTDELKNKEISSFALRLSMYFTFQIKAHFGQDERNMPGCKSSTSWPWSYKEMEEGKLGNPWCHFSLNQDFVVVVLYVHNAHKAFSSKDASPPVSAKE